MKPNHPTIPCAPTWTPTRRHFLKQSGLCALLPAVAAAQSPSLVRTPTSVRVCPRYDYPLVRETMKRMLDEIGGIGHLVNNQSVAVKVNLVNSPTHTWGTLDVGLTNISHPVVAMALGSLLVEAGARRVVFCDQLPVEELGAAAFEPYGYHLKAFQEVMGERVRFENTRNRGSHSDYAIVKTETAGFLATGWEVNRAYTECDVLVSLAKLKNHVSGGVTLGMKNLYGVPPSSLYGNDAHEPNEAATGYRNATMHDCTRKAVTSVDLFTGKTVEGDHGFNVPHFIVDLNAAFPIQLTIIDGISTISTAEGTWMGQQVQVCRPNLLVAGFNPVCTDAVAAHVMGFDPDAEDGTQPFVNGVNHIRLARSVGLGENRIANLDIVGEPIDAVRYPFQPTYQRERSL